MALEHRDHDQLIIQAELPGLDPDRDIEVWVSHAVLHIRARKPRGAPEHPAGSDLSDGEFSRDIALPADAGADAVVASYSDGRLEVRTPLGVGRADAARRVPVRAQRPS